MAILEAHDNRRRELGRALHTLAERIGHVPRLEAAPVSSTLVTGGGRGATSGLGPGRVLRAHDHGGAERVNKSIV
jgi:hypothetical protein